MRTRRLGWLLGLVLLLVLSGCVTLPVSGPVEAGRGPSQAPSGPVEIQPEPPGRDASANLVVEGFLHAMANDRSDYAVAREYLSAEAREGWRPDQAVLVYGDGSPTGTEDDVVLDVPLVGVVGADRAYTDSDSRYRIDFEMERDADGQWRIGNPPPGLLISQYLFERFYSGLNVYFFDPQLASLVPDRIYVPGGEQTATTLVEALLDGPNRWLAPAVVSVVPEQTELGVSIPITPEGIAEVSFNDAVNELNADQRARMAAQVTWTLRQLPQISAVRFLVDANPYVVPGQSADGTLPVGSFDYLAPIPQTVSGELYISDGAVVGRSPEAGSVDGLVPIDGPLGVPPEPIAALAVSSTRRIAVVSADRTRLLVSDEVVASPLDTPLDGVDGLLDPQFSRFQDLWTLSVDAAGTTARVVKGSEVMAVQAPALADKQVTDFRVSPDGTRMAVVHRVGSRTELGLALIRRGDTPTIDSYRPIALLTTTGTRLDLVDDVTWFDDVSLMLLARPDDSSQPLPWVVDIDGARIAQVGGGSWDAVALRSAPAESAPRAAAIGADGELWVRQADYDWPQVQSGVVAAAYPS